MEWYDWEVLGKPVPPPDIVKQFTVKMYGNRFSLQTLIETGTYLGGMIIGVKDTFRRIISVELEPRLYERAKLIFSSDPQISILFGDSGEVLPEILAAVTKPCLFWLDGHWSGGYVKTAKGNRETPILQELHHIFRHPVKEHVILIDDARMFVGQNDYPTLDELRKLAKSYDSTLQFHVEHDIIRIHK